MKMDKTGRPIKLFMLIHDLAPFGAQRVALQTVKNINKRLFRVTVCSFWGDETLAPEFVNCGAEVVFLGARRFLDLSAWFRLAVRLFRSRPDIIQINLAELSFPVRLLSLFLPGLHVVHAVQNPLSSEPWYWRFLNRMTLRMCDAIAFGGKGIVEEIVRKAPSLKGRFFVVQNGVELDVPPAGAGAGLREELGIAADENVIGCVGRLVRQKGQDILIDAAAGLAGEKRRIRILLAGDGELLPELRERVKRLGIEREVIFLGRRADIARILSACDIYAAPSRWESFNIALGEAMLSGRPCVATDIPGHADLLLDGVTGVAIPAENADALAKAIARLLDNPAGAQKLAAAAAELVRTEFTVEKMAKKYEELYLSLIKPSTTPASFGERIHVFYFIHDLAPFGMQHSTLYIAKSLDRSRFRVTVCSFWGDETMVSEFLKCGAEVVLLRAKRFFSLSAWIRLARCLFSARPDIIETTLPELGVPIRLLSVFLPGASIVHRFRNPLSSEPWYWRFLNRMTLRMCDAIAFSSKGIVEEIVRQAPSLKGRFFVVQNGVEMDVPPAGAGAGLREELGIAADEKVIGCVGRLVRQKGQDILIGAAARLAGEKRRIRLLLAGDGELLPELRERVKRLGLEREVIFLGRRADIARILSACDIYAAPSRWESFNIALGEAMLSGRPCVATDIPGHADLLLDGVTGVAIPTENAAALAKAIARLLDQPDEAQRIALAAKEMVRAEFTIDKMAAKCEKLYLDLRRR